MKLKLLSGLIAASLSMTAFADTSASNTSSNTNNQQAVPTAQQQKKISKLEAQIVQLQGQLNTVANSPKLAKIAQLTQTRIMSDRSNPFGMMPDTTMSFSLLQSRQSFNAPLVLGGYLEADAQAWAGNSIATTAGTYHNGNSVYLTTAKLYTLANINNWTSIFLSLQGNTNAATPTTFDQAFVTIGNLQKYPIYLMVGRGYLPFGSFAGNGVWSNSITTSDFRTSETNQINLGFYQNGLSLNIAAANSGYSNDTAFGNNISNFVYNASYTNTFKKWNYSIGASYMNDIRGTNNNIGNAYGSSSSGAAINGGSNGAYDINGALGYNTVSVNAEYASTVNSATLNSNDSNTGRISSWMTTVNYAPVLWGEATTFSLGYSASLNAANIPYGLSAMFNNAPSTSAGQGFKNQWIAFAQRPIYNNVYLGPEVDYAKTYANTHTWTGTLDLSAYF